MQFSQELEESLRYLNSDAALKSLKSDPYWPKWNSTWWQMLVLHEMGLSKEIPKSVVSAYIDAINQMPLKIFPIQSDEIPEGVDPYRGIPCHCQLGNVYQVLAEHRVDVDQKIPWLRPWFLRYQMADGGLSCDSEAYRVQGEVPSSMVGTIAVFEAVLLHTNRPWTDDERNLIAKGAEFLLGRKLMLGSSTEYNAEERADESEWLKLCFPRLYFYDVLRGLNAILLWAEKTKSWIPVESVEGVVRYLDTRFPEGLIRNERQAYRGTGTILQSSSGEWLRKQPATFFPLLQSVSRMDEVSPFLTQQWSEAKRRLKSHDHLRGLLNP
jgi:hypothetical protein